MVKWKGESDMPKKVNSIKVTFKDNERENALYSDIMQASEFGQSAWMKQAAIEKLERDNGGKQMNCHSENTRTIGTVSSMDDLFM